MFRDWTLDETLFVRDYAGTVPLSDLARHLRRDARDVAGECARLGVPFVYVGTPLFWCSECASWARRARRRESAKGARSSWRASTSWRRRTSARSRRGKESSWLVAIS